MSRAVTLAAWEAVTSVGESAAETVALWRAGVGNVQASHFVDGAGQPVLVCASPALPPDLLPPHRRLALAALCLQRLCDRLAETGDAEAPCIALAAGPDAEVPGFAEALREGLPARWANARLEIAADAITSLTCAVQRLRQGHPCLWGGVGSLLDGDVVDALLAQDLLVTQDNVDGVRPGEAAAFMALGDPGAAGEVQIVASGAAPVDQDAPARALIEALRQASKPLSGAGQRTRWWISDTGHEAEATRSVQLASALLGDVWAPRGDWQMPLKELGQVGAAALPLLAVLAAETWRQGHAPDRRALVSAREGRHGFSALLMAGPGALRAVEERP